MADPSVTGPPTDGAAAGTVPADPLVVVPDAVEAPPDKHRATDAAVAQLRARRRTAPVSRNPLVWFRRWMSSTVGLRRRILLTFTFGSLALATFLAVTTYGLVRSNLLDQRDSASLQAAARNAQEVQRELRSTDDASEAVKRLTELGVRAPIVRHADEWAAGTGRFTAENIPLALRGRVLDDGQWSRMIVDTGHGTVLVVGVPIPQLGAYFEFFELGEDEQTLNNVALSLLLASLITTALGVVLGIFAARRAVRPVAQTALAAKAIAGGHLETRLPPTDDPDLGVLASSFNDMASALQQRIERDARFASDVSHELRSPLMTLSASVEVMEARRHELSDRGQSALDLLTGDVSRFQGLVEDLLEISRFDAGAIRLHLEDLQVTAFVRNAVAISSAPSVKVTATPRAERAWIRGDRRRLARVVANLIDNAKAYGGGDPEITISDANPPDELLTHVRIGVEDHGPGVPIEERALIFERFARGVTAGRRTSSEGAGLGLALVDEHVRMHGGRVWVEDRPDGRSGARFVIELNAGERDVDHDDEGDFA